MVVDTKICDVCKQAMPDLHPVKVWGYPIADCCDVCLLHFGDVIEGRRCFPPLKDAPTPQVKAWQK